MKTTVATVRQQKKDGDKITMLDSIRLFYRKADDEAGIDMILVERLSRNGNAGL